MLAAAGMALAAATLSRQHIAQFVAMGALAVLYARITADDLVRLMTTKRTQKKAQRGVGTTRHWDSVQVLAKLTEVQYPSRSALVFCSLSTIHEPLTGVV
jgi:hypothetical protein